MRRQGQYRGRSHRLAASAAGAVAAMLTAAAAVVAAVAGGGPAAAAGRPLAASGQMALFASAAREFGVPLNLLLAVGYTESRWQPPGDGPSIDGGYGLMDLTARTFDVTGGRGAAGAPGRARVTLDKTHYTLPEAARLLHLPQAVLKTSSRQNVRGAAAVLASLARGLNGGRLPSSLGGWYGALAAYSGDTIAQTAGLFASDVFSTLRTGAALTTPGGQRMSVAAVAGVRPDRATIARLGLKPQPRASAGVDCPASLHCRFVPAAYQEIGTDPGNYGNYDLAHRPADLKINSIVIHDTEGSYAAAIATFQNPRSYVSANYVIQSSTGDITEMVRPQDVAWAAGDWYYNTHSISIEHEGFATQGATWYTQAMMKASATLVRYLAAKYHIPLDRQHIIGHDNVPGPTNSYTAAQHWDPGPFWNWTHYMSLVHQVSVAAEVARGGSLQRGTHQVVTIDPVWARNQPPVTDCSGGTCVTLPTQPASFVYLRTQPSGSAPLLGDPVLHPSGSAGTTQADDWGDKAPVGEKYVIAGQRGDWTGIWFAGREGWFYNPPGAGQTARYTGGTVITPKPGRSPVPVYGSAFPGASAYPAGVPVQQNAALAYRILAGQAYVTTGLVPDDYYYTVTYNSSAPHDHTVISGTTRYYQIVLSHRLFYVKAADVSVKTLS